jgi:hypothetical protein
MELYLHSHICLHGIVVLSHAQGQLDLLEIMRNDNTYMRFVWTEVEIHIVVFWVMTPCCLVDSNVLDKHTASIFRATPRRL